MPIHQQVNVNGQGRTGSSSLSARKGELGGTLPAAPNGIDYRALREAVSITQVLDLCDWRPVSRSGPQLRGPCPIHKSSSEHSRSLSVNTERNLFQCFGCGKKGNQLDLWVAISRQPLFTAALDLARRLQIEPARIEKKNL